MANQPSVHPFHDIARPGDTINWGWGTNDNESHTLTVGYDGKLEWGYDEGYRDLIMRTYWNERKRLLYAGLAGQLPLAECRQDLEDLDEGLAEGHAWGWGDATPALDEYAREYPFR